MNLLKLFSVLLFAACSLTVSEARADSVVITGGSFTQDLRPGHDYDITGEGFRAKGYGPYGRTACLPCHPGSVLDLDNQYAGVEELGAGPATFNGTDYSLLFYGGQLTFRTDSFEMPLISQLGLITVSVPFTFTGRLVGYTERPHPAPQVFSLDLTGQGVALLQLSSYIDQNGVQAYAFQSLTYNFQPAPVPEPATLLLLGTGLMGVAAARRRRRKSLRDN